MGSSRAARRAGYQPKTIGDGDDRPGQVDGDGKRLPECGAKPFGNQDQPDPTQRTGDGSEECQRERLGEEEPENGSIVHPQQFPDSDLTDSFPDGDQEYAEGPRFSAMPAR